MLIHSEIPWHNKDLQSVVEYIQYTLQCTQAGTADLRFPPKASEVGWGP